MDSVLNRSNSKNSQEKLYGRCSVYIYMAILGISVQFPSIYTVIIIELLQVQQ